MAGLFLYFLSGHIRYRRVYKLAAPSCNAEIMRWLRENQLKRRRVRIRVSPDISAPLTYGVFWPVILIPKGAAWENSERLRYVLTHEMTHIRRFDAAIKLLLLVAACAHWFNPLAWVMYTLANRDLEITCDEKTVRKLGMKSRAAYAWTLIALSEQRAGVIPFGSAFAKNAIEERTAAIMKMKKASRIGISTALLLVFCLSAVLAASALSARAEPADYETGEQIRTIIDFPVNANGQTYGSGIHPDYDLIEPPDLIFALGIDGTHGYISRVESEWPIPLHKPENPEEAMVYMAELETLISEAIARGDKYLCCLPLYASDGETIIGEYGYMSLELR